MKRLAWYTLAIVFVLSLLVLLWQFRSAVLLFLFSLTIAAVLRPLINRLVERRVPRGVAIPLTYLLGFTIIGLPIFLAGGSFMRELQLLTDRFAAAYTWFKATGNEGSQFQAILASRLPPIDALYESVAGERGAVLAQSVLGFASGVFGFFSNLLIAIVLSIYWSVDRVHFERLWLSLLPGRQRARAREIWRETESGVGAYIRSELVQSLLTAILLGLVYWALGLEYPITLAVIGALAWLIPWLGAVLAIVPAFLIGFSESLILGIAAALVTMLVLGVMEIVIEPRLFNRRRYSSLLVVLMVIVMADAFGLAGLLFAPPLAAAIQIFFSDLLSQPSVEPFQAASAQLASLRVRYGQVQEMAASMEEPAPQIGSLVQRLGNLLEETEEALGVEPVVQAGEPTVKPSEG